MKNLINPTVLMSAGVMTGTSKISSTPLDVRTMTAVCIQASWTGTPTGSFAVEGSLDYVPSGNGSSGNAGTWTDLQAGISGPAGSTGSILVDLQRTAVAYIRLSYTNASGSGTLTVIKSAKGV